MSNLKEMARKAFEEEVVHSRSYSDERDANGLYVQEGLQTAWRNFWRGYESASEAPPEGTVPMPTTVAQAKGMALIGQSWLEQNAPDELKGKAAGGEWVIQLVGDYRMTRGNWERPDHRGYTNDLREAGRYSEAEARHAERMRPEKYKAVKLPQPHPPAKVPEWIKCSERLPSEDHPFECWYSSSGEAPSLMSPGSVSWNYAHGNAPDAKWMCSGLKRPNPPQTEGE